LRRGEILLDNGGNPGKIVIERGGRRPDPNLINPVAQAFQPVLAQAKACGYLLMRSKRGLLC